MTADCCGVFGAKEPIEDVRTVFRRDPAASIGHL